MTSTNNLPCGLQTVTTSQTSRRQVAGSSTSAVALGSTPFGFAGATADREFIDSRGAELRVVQRGVPASPGEQLLVHALLDDAALVHHQDVVRIAEGGPRAANDVQ